MTSKAFKEIFPLDTTDDTVSDLSDLKDDSWISTDDEAGRLVRRTYTYPYDAQTRAKRRHVRFWDEVEPEEQARKETPIAFLELEKPELLPELLAKKDVFLASQEMEAINDNISGMDSPKQVDISIDLPSSVIDSDFDDPLGMNESCSSLAPSFASQGLSITSQPLFSQPNSQGNASQSKTSTPQRNILASQINTRKLKFSECESSPDEPGTSKDSFKTTVLAEINLIKNQILKLQESILTHPFPNE